MEMVTEVKRVLDFFDIVNFLDDLGFDVGNFIVELGLLGIRVEFSFETFLAHGLKGLFYSNCYRGNILPVIYRYYLVRCDFRDQNEFIIYYKSSIHFQAKIIHLLISKNTRIINQIIHSKTLS
jgi:hypothetical protein